MTREDYLKMLIKKHGSQRKFAQYIGMPPTTLFSILRNVGGASIDNIVKICKGLGIMADDLVRIAEDGFESHKGYYTDCEAADLAKYLRTRPEARMLFSAAKDMSREDMEKVVEYIELLKLKYK